MEQIVLNNTEWTQCVGICFVMQTSVINLTTTQRKNHWGMYVKLREILNPALYAKKQERVKAWRKSNKEHLRHYEKNRHLQRHRDPIKWAVFKKGVARWQKLNPHLVSANQRKHKNKRAAYRKRWLRANAFLKSEMDRRGYAKRKYGPLANEALLVFDLKQTIWAAKRYLADVKPVFTKGKTDENKKRNNLRLCGPKPAKSNSRLSEQTRKRLSTAKRFDTKLRRAG